WRTIRRARRLRPERACPWTCFEGQWTAASALPRSRLREAAMIPRYTRPEMAKIWAPETRFRIWFEIEAHAATAMAELGLIPNSAAKAIWDKGSQAKFDVARIDEIEREVKHDVIAFLTHLAEHV